MKPSADKDAAVKAWMKAKGWKMADTEDDARKQVYLWIHYPARGAPLV